MFSKTGKKTPQPDHFLLFWLQVPSGVWKRLPDLEPTDQQDKEQKLPNSRQKNCWKGLARQPKPNPRPKRGFLLVLWILALSLTQSLLRKLLKDVASVKLKSKRLLVSLEASMC